MAELAKKFGIGSKNSCLCLIFGFFMSGAVFAAKRFEIQQKMLGSPLGLFFESKEDPEGNFGLNEILRIDAAGGLLPSEEEVPNYGLSQSVQWVKFALYNPTNQPVLVLLENKFTYVDKFTLYYQDLSEAWQFKVAGDQVPFRNREVSTRQLVFKVYLQPGNNRFYARSQATGAHQLPLYIWTQDEFFKHNAIEYGSIGLLFGFHLVICLYNLFLYYSLRDPTYLCYVSYVVCNLIYQGSGLGIFQQMLSDLSLAEVMSNKTMIVSVDLVAISALLFSYMFLDLRKRLPSLSKIYLFIGAIDFLNLFITGFGAVWLGTIICIINASLATLVLILSGLLIAREGHKPAVFYLIAWTCYLLGVTATLINLVGLLPTSNLTRWGQFTGGALEIAILSLALGARINAKRKKQVDRISDLNMALEKKVDELLNEAHSRKAMAAKAAHHLNNPIQAIVGLSSSMVQESRNIKSRLEPMFPDVSARTPEIQQEIDLFRASFAAIETDMTMMTKSIKRATTISNELRIVSGIHGVHLESLSLGYFWMNLISEIKDDDLLGMRPIIVEDMLENEACHESWLEPVSFTRSIFYVLKEGLETLDSDTKVQLTAALLDSGSGHFALEITATASTGLKALVIAQWRELKFCQDLLSRYGASISVKPSNKQLIIEVGLPLFKHNFSEDDPLGRRVDAQREAG